MEPFQGDIYRATFEEDLHSADSSSVSPTNSIINIADERIEFTSSSKITSNRVGPWNRTIL